MKVFKAFLKTILSGITAVAILSVIMLGYYFMPLRVENNNQNTDYVLGANRPWSNLTEGISYGITDANGYNNKSVTEDPEIIFLGSSHLQGMCVMQKENMCYLLDEKFEGKYQFVFTSFCWILFRADSFEHAIEIITRIFSFSTGLEQPYLWLFVSLIIYFAAVVFAVIKSRKNENKSKKLNVSTVEGYYPVLNLSKYWQLTIFFVFVGITFAFAYTGGSPFIYGNY